jgi:hypothetical protein
MTTVMLLITLLTLMALASAFTNDLLPIHSSLYVPLPSCGMQGAHGMGRARYTPAAGRADANTALVTFRWHLRMVEALSLSLTVVQIPDPPAALSSS